MYLHTNSWPSYYYIPTTRNSLKIIGQKNETILSVPSISDSTKWLVDVIYINI